MKGRSIPYSTEELAWIEANKELPRRDAHAAFCKKFRRADVSMQNYKALCTRRGWKTGRTGQFNPGEASHNKGKKMPFNPNSARTQFKKGRLPHNYRGAGHERVDSKDGYIVMIVEEVNPWTGAATRPVHKHRYLWEQKHGPLPDEHVLKCLDGDKTNTDPANWEAIPRAMLPSLVGGRWQKPIDDYEPELRSAVLAIAKAQHAAREATKREDK